MIDIRFAKYAFKDILKQLHYSGIYDIVITKEDNDLVIRIPVGYLVDKKHEISECSDCLKDCKVERTTDCE